MNRWCTWWITALRKLYTAEWELAIAIRLEFGAAVVWSVGFISKGVVQYRKK
jgi:hypothetical protein